MIPRGCTDKYQPLDYRFCGALKSEGRSYLNHKISDEILELFDMEKNEFKGLPKICTSIDKKESAVLLEQLWKKSKTRKYC